MKYGARRAPTQTFARRAQKEATTRRTWCWDGPLSSSSCRPRSPHHPFSTALTLTLNRLLFSNNILSRQRRVLGRASIPHSTV